jgi:hypothetical protein
VSASARLPQKSEQANAAVEVMRNTTAGLKPGSRSGIVIARFGTPRAAIMINRNG